MDIEEFEDIEFEPMEEKPKKPNIQEVFPEHRFQPQSRKFMFFSAQSNTPSASSFLQAARLYEEKHGYQIGCTSMIYQTLTPFTTRENRDFDWAPELDRYMISETLKLNSLVELYPHMRSTATALHPLRGEPNRTPRSIIIPTNRPHVLPVASPKGQRPSYFLGMGSATIPNFRPGKMGTRAVPGHTIGALIVEIQDDQVFFWRHIEWDGEGFYDLDRYVTAEKITYGHRAEALIWGDIHAETTRPEVWRASQSMHELMRPKRDIWHDVWSFENGHHRDFFDKLRNPHRLASRSAEVAAQLMDQHQKDFKKSELVIVPSNHHRHLQGWIERFKVSECPGDFDFYASVVSRTKNDPFHRDCFYHAMDIYAKSQTMRKVKFLDKGESFVICGRETGGHGDIGANGARGSAAGFAAMTFRQLHGHTHKVYRDDNSASAGTSAQPSESWHSSYGTGENAHIALYPNGAFTQLIMWDDKWRLAACNN